MHLRGRQDPGNQEESQPPGARQKCQIQTGRHPKGEPTGLNIIEGVQLGQRSRPDLQIRTTILDTVHERNPAGTRNPSHLQVQQTRLI